MVKARRRNSQTLARPDILVPVFPLSTPTTMFTYQIPPRIFGISPGKRLFPADCVISFHLQPLQPFGESATGGHTAVQSTPASAFFNANNGEHYIESKPSLAPLDVAIEEPVRTVFDFSGKDLTLSQRFESLVELEQVITSLYFVLPPLLNVSFADPPYIERVDGIIGQHGFDGNSKTGTWRLDYESRGAGETRRQGMGADRDSVIQSTTASRRTSLLPPSLPTSTCWGYGG